MFGGVYQAIDAIVNIKPKYPERLAGTRMFELMLSLYENADKFVSGDFVGDLRGRLKKIIEKFHGKYRRVSACHKVVMRIWGILEEGGSSDYVRRKLRSFVNSLRSSDCPIRGFLTRLRRLVKRWLWGLFVAYDDPVIPRTNQRLEAFNARVRGFARKVTCGYNAERYEISRGVLYCFVLDGFDVSVADLFEYFGVGMRALDGLRVLLRRFGVDPRVRWGFIRRFLGDGQSNFSLPVGIDRYLKNNKIDDNVD